MKTMKHFFKLVVLASVAAALIFGLSLSNPAKKAESLAQSVISK